MKSIIYVFFLLSMIIIISSCGIFSYKWEEQTVSVPEPMIVNSKVVAVQSSGYSSGNVILEDGSLLVWGNSTHLNIIERENILTPAKAMIKSDNTLWAWGDNTNGELGAGTTLGLYMKHAASFLGYDPQPTCWPAPIKVIEYYEHTHFKTIPFSSIRSLL